MRIFVPLEKCDEEKRLAIGYASTPALDSQGEIVKREAVEAALPSHMRFANVREMHRPSAVGVAQEAGVDAHGLRIVAKVIDRLPPCTTNAVNFVDHYGIDYAAASLPLAKDTRS